MTVQEQIKRAFRIVGTQAKLGAAMGVTQNAVWQAWKRGRVTAEMALGIDRATKGKVSASELRPDLWPTRRHVPKS